MKAIPTIPLHRYHTISTITLLEIMALRASHYGSRVQGAQRRSPRIAGAIHAPRMRCDKRCCVHGRADYAALAVSVFIRGFRCASPTATVVAGATRQMAT